MEIEEFKEESKKYVLSNRKKYIDWINNVFYKIVLDDKGDDYRLKIYQRFVKN